MMVKLVSVESYISGFSIVSMKNPDIYNCRNSQGLFPRNSQTSSMPFHLFISVPTFVTCVSKMTSRGCVNSSESFCCICGELVVKKQQRNITDFVCGDLKAISVVLGQQGGYTKFPCFLCEWDSRAKAKHWNQKVWPKRTLKVGEKNVRFESLVDPKKVILPPLHIKLGIMKQFVKALQKDAETFKYLSSKFLSLSEAKLKDVVFVGPDIRKLMKDNNFENVMNDVERSAWNSFKDVVTKFLGNQKDPDFENIVKNMLCNFKNLGCSMSFKFFEFPILITSRKILVQLVKSKVRGFTKISPIIFVSMMGYKYDGRLLLDAA